MADISIFDSVQVADVTGNYPDQVVVFEAVDIQYKQLDVSPNDSSTLTEDVTLVVVEMGSVGDDVATTDIPGFYPDLVIVTESVGLSIMTPIPFAVFDSVATSEDTTLVTSWAIDVFDSTTTSENLGEGGVLYVNIARSGVRIV